MPYISLPLLQKCPPRNIISSTFPKSCQRLARKDSPWHPRGRRKAEDIKDHFFDGLWISKFWDPDWGVRLAHHLLGHHREAEEGVLWQVQILPLHWEQQVQDQMNFRSSEGLCLLKMFEAKAPRAHLSSSQKLETRIKAEALSKYKHLSPTFTFDVPHFECISPL